MTDKTKPNVPRMASPTGMAALSAAMDSKTGTTADVQHAVSLREILLDLLDDAHVHDQKPNIAISFDDQVVIGAVDTFVDRDVWCHLDAYPIIQRIIINKAMATPIGPQNRTEKWHARMGGPMLLGALAASDHQVGLVTKAELVKESSKIPAGTSMT